MTNALFKSARLTRPVVLLLAVLVAALGFAWMRWRSNETLTKLVVRVDAPQMHKGPGSVVLIDSSLQPEIEAQLPALVSTRLRRVAGKNITNADPGMPFLYLSLQWQSGRKTVLTSKNLLKWEKKNPTDELMMETLQKLKVSHSVVLRALKMAEHSEVHDEPLLSRKAVPPKIPATTAARKP